MSLYSVKINEYTFLLAKLYSLTKIMKSQVESLSI